MPETRCEDCGKHPVVIHHTRCQACLVRLATKRPGAGARE
jgi:hypothetical protein